MKHVPFMSAVGVGTSRYPSIVGGRVLSDGQVLSGGGAFP